MTKNNSISKLKNKSLWILAVICLLCFSMFFFTACGNNTSDDDDDTTYTKTETDIGDITNSTFEFGSLDLDLDDYPQTSPSGWSKSIDNSAKSVSVKSGIVSIDAWDNVLKNLYDNSAFLSYVEEKFGFDSEQIKSDVKAENSSLTDDEVTDKVKDRFVEFLTDETNGKMKKPASPVEGSKKVYMLNNYVSEGFGSAQKVTSSSTVTLDKASVYKISVWVNTYNLDFYSDNKGGANIRLINNFNGTAQAPFGIYGINTANEWKQYNLYVKTDSDIDCSVQLVLGLGFGNGNSTNVADYTSGTVLFDEISIEKIEETAIPSTASETIFDYEQSTENQKYTKATDFDYIYNMKLSDALSNTIGYYEKLNANTLCASHELTKTFNNVTSETILDAANSYKGDKIEDGFDFKIENIKNASITLASNVLDCPAESYVYYSFKIENALSKFDKNGVTVYVYDVDGTTEKTVTSVGTFSTVGEDELCTIIVKNSFDTSKQYSIKIVIGPTAITDLKNADDFSSGTIIIKDLYTTKGSVYEYVDDNPFNNKTDYYDYYSLFTATANKTVSLLGSESSVPEDETDSTFNFNVSPTEFGTIRTTTAKVKNYKGVDADSQYIKEESNKTTIDERSGKVGDINGFAGLINTKYLDGYSDFTLKNETSPSLTANEIKTSLNHSGDDIQPLMIYNKNASAYGYFGNSTTISASSYAKISVKVRVVGDAVAYVYLVNTANVSKTVINLDTFTVNTDGYDYKTTDTVIDNKQLSFKIDSSMMNDDGWCEVTFYVATGATSKSFRLEMWNGSRDGQDNSQGFVFFDLPDSAITTSSAFSEPTSWVDMFATGGTLSGLREDVKESAMHQRELDETEKKFNKEQNNNESLVSYDAKYVWIKGDNFIYAVYNTIDPVAVDPYANETEDDETSGSGCTAETDPSTFWLSFSTILLGAVLILAIVMLFVKNIRRRHKRNKKDAKSHYNVTSRYNKKNKPSKAKQDFDDYEEEPEQPVLPDEQPTEDAQIDETDNSNDYVYGDVQDFGDDNKDNN